MIRFEINELPFAITNDQFGSIAYLIVGDLSLNYDVVEGDTDSRIWLWVHPEDESINPTRHWIEVDGTISLTEEVDWDWKGLTS